MNKDYRKSHIGSDKALSYDRQFSENPYRSLIWRLEQNFLIEFFNKTFKGRDVKLLDFACGTGRIINAVSEYSSEALGIDVSEDMLAIARERNPHCNFENRDITITNCEQNKKFNCITAFRFFPNAQSELRNAAFSALVEMLADDGYIIFNNHKNVDSIVYRLSHLIPFVETRRGMSTEEIHILLSLYNLEIVKEYGIGKFPATDRFKFVPLSFLHWFERWCNKKQILHGLSCNIIYVCKRNT